MTESRIGCEWSGCCSGCSGLGGRRLEPPPSPLPKKSPAALVSSPQNPPPCLLLFSFSSLLGFPLLLRLFRASAFLEGGADRAALVSGSREGHSDGIQWGDHIWPSWEKWSHTPHAAPSPATAQPGGASEHHPPACTAPPELYSFEHDIT